MRKILITCMLIMLALCGTFMLTSCSASLYNMVPEVGENGNLWIGDQDTGILVEHSHDYVKESDGVAPTCTATGYDIYNCSICGAFKYNFIPAVGHTWDDGETVLQATASQKGLKLLTCKTCAETKMELTVVEYSVGLDYEAIKGETEYAVVGIGECVDSEIVIPDEHEGLPVTEIGEKAFYQCKTISSIKLPETVKFIGNKAFSECDLLVDISMPDKVEIGIDIFRGSINVNITLKHTLEYVEAKEATCTEPGNIAYYFCEACNHYYSDEEGINRLYDVIIPNSHDFVDGYCQKCWTVQSEVLIVSIEDTITNLGKFSLGTLENAIGLPETVNVYTADSIMHTLPIAWNLSAYDKSTVGVYNIMGHIQAPGLIFNDGLSNQITATIEIVDYIEGTADIVFVLDISGSMEDEINNVKENVVEFAQRLEAEGVSARWSAITYSDPYDEPGNPNEYTNILLNGTTPWFASALEYQYAIDSINLANGGDWPEVAVDGLMAADSLEKRQDARVFYILLTDADYKTNNEYGVDSMEEAVDIINENGVNISVITDSSCFSTYSYLTATTGGIMSNIYEDFANDLFESLIPIIYEDVIA